MRHEVCSQQEFGNKTLAKLCVMGEPYAAYHEILNEYIDDIAMACREIFNEDCENQGTPHDKNVENHFTEKRKSKQ